MHNPYRLGGPQSGQVGQKEFFFFSFMVQLDSDYKHVGQHQGFTFSSRHEKNIPAPLALCSLDHYLPKLGRGVGRAWGGGVA